MRFTPDWRCLLSTLFHAHSAGVLNLARKLVQVTLPLAKYSSLGDSILSGSPWTHAYTTRIMKFMSLRSSVVAVRRKSILFCLPSMLPLLFRPILYFIHENLWPSSVKPAISLKRAGGSCPHTLKYALEWVVLHILQSLARLLLTTPKAGVRCSASDERSHLKEELCEADTYYCIL